MRGCPAPGAHLLPFGAAEVGGRGAIERGAIGHGKIIGVRGEVGKGPAAIGAAIPIVCRMPRGRPIVSTVVYGLSTATFVLVGALYGGHVLIETGGFAIRLWMLAILVVVQNCLLVRAVWNHWKEVRK